MLKSFPQAGIVVRFCPHSFTWKEMLPFRHGGGSCEVALPNIDAHNGLLYVWCWIYNVEFKSNQ